MKKVITLVLVMVLSLVGCNKNQVVDNSSASETEPTDVINDEPQEFDLYEEYIATVAKGTYRYVDLDEDGIQELFIYRNSGTSEVATVLDGQVERVFSASHMFLCEGGIIGRWGEGGGGQTLFYYKIENHEAVIVDIITTTYNDDTWYHSTDANIQYVSPKTMNPITKEAACNIIKAYVLLGDSMPQYLSFFYVE